MYSRQFKLNNVGRPLKLTKKNNIIKRSLDIGKNQNILFEIEDNNLNIIKKKVDLTEQEEQDLIKTQKLLLKKLLPSVIPFSYYKYSRSMYMQKYESDLNDFKGLLTFRNSIVEILELLRTVKILAKHKLFYIDIKLANIFVKEIKNGVYGLYLGDVDSIQSNAPYTYTICTSNTDILMMLPGQQLFVLNTLYYALIVTIFNILIFKTRFNVSNKFNNKDFFNFFTNSKNEERLYEIGDISLFDEYEFIKNYNEIQEKHVYLYIVNLIISYLNIQDGIFILKPEDLINQIDNIIKKLTESYYKDR
mgnify:CR=1 FL=1